MDDGNQLVPRIMDKRLQHLLCSIGQLSALTIPFADTHEALPKEMKQGQGINVEQSHTRVNHVKGLGGALGVGRLPRAVHRVVESSCGQLQGEAGWAVLLLNDALSCLSQQDSGLRVISVHMRRARLTMPS